MVKRNLVVSIFSILPTKFITWIINTMQNVLAFKIMKEAGQGEQISNQELEDMFKEFQSREALNRNLILAGCS